MGSVKLGYRLAKLSDIENIVRLLADDTLGKTREDVSSPLNSKYIKAFNQIDVDPNNELYVVEHQSSFVGMLQLTFIPYITHIGSVRCLIEGVRIDKNYRGQGMGAIIFNWAIEYARRKECTMVQLTSDKSRPEAIKFYERLGFKATHEGLKLKL